MASAAAIPTREAVPAAVLALIGRLRESGVPVSTSESLDAVTALGVVDLASRNAVKAAMKATLVKDPTRTVTFERAFEAVFPRPLSPQPASSASSGNDSEASDLVSALLANDEASLEALLDDAIDQFAGEDDGRSVGHHAQRTLRRLDVPNLYRRYLEQASGESDLDRALNAAEASAAIKQMTRRLEDLLAGRLRPTDDRASKQQFEDAEDRPLLRAGADELAAMRQAMRPLARRLATRLGIRRRRGSAGLDMRRTIRASMGTGGVPVAPVLRRRRATKPDLVVLCDVSGSTAQFAPFTLMLLHAVHQEFRRVRSFAFIDGVVEISDLLAGSPGVLDPQHLLSRPGLIVKDGRSDYARAFSSFLDQYGESVTARTTVIVAGDARSHDRPPGVDEVRQLAHQSRRLYWLNPEARAEWDSLDSRASDYAQHCSDAFQVSTIRQLVSAVTLIV